MITLTLYTPLSQFLYTVLSRSIAACPQVFSSGGTCTLLPSFLGVHPHFLGCNVPSNSSFGGTKKINCIFSTQGRAPCCFCKYYAVGENFFFLSDIWSDRKWGSVWPMAFVSVPPFFCNIVYNLSNFVFFIQNWMQDYLYIVMIIKQLN